MQGFILGGGGDQGMLPTPQKIKNGCAILRICLFAYCTFQVGCHWVIGKSHPFSLPYSSKFSRSKTSVIQPAQLLTDNIFRDSLLL